MSVIPNYSGKHKCEDLGPDRLGINSDLISKISKTKKAGGVAQGQSVCLARVESEFKPQYCYTKVYLYLTS
jgi:hypothetical protein